MWIKLAGGRVVRVGAVANIARLEIAVDDAGSISGEIRDRLDTVRTFEGWLEMISLLEEWRAGTVADRDTRAPDSKTPLAP